jgi:hypothetical protein
MATTSAYVTAVTSTPAVHVTSRDSHWNAIHRKRRRCTLTRRSDQNTGPALPARWPSSTTKMIQRDHFWPRSTPYIICICHYVSLSLYSRPIDQTCNTSALHLRNCLLLFSVTANRALQGCTTFRPGHSGPRLLGPLLSGLNVERDRAIL